MAALANPYAPPVADVGQPAPAGEVTRDGKHVRLLREAAMPDRCIGCNRPAEGRRIAQRGYWSPLPWRVALVAVPVALIGASVVFIELIGVAILPTILVLTIANAFIRKSLDLELGLCRRHARLRAALTGLIFAGVAGGLLMLVVVVNAIHRIDSSMVGPVGAGLILLMLGSAVVRSLLPPGRVRLARLDARHAWLSGTGKAFRESLPEAPRP